MLSEDTIDAIRLFHMRREARLRQRLADAEDLMERYRLLKAIYANRRSASKMFGERNFYGQPLDIGGKSYTIKFQNISADGGPGSGNFGHKGVPGQVGGSAPSDDSGSGGGSCSSAASSPSATGANVFKRGFSKRNLDAHFGGSHDHSHEYPDMTKDQYAERAMTLIQSPVGKGILGYKNAKGQVARFDTETGDFVKGHPDKGIATMFKPARGKEYFDDWKGKEGVNDGNSEG